MGYILVLSCVEARHKYFSVLETRHTFFDTTVNSRYSGHPGDGHLVSVIPRVRSNGGRRKFSNFSVQNVSSK